MGKLVQMKNNVPSGGDSGGPWYYGGKAYGTHAGSVSGGSLFTTIRILRDRTDSKVFTK